MLRITIVYANYKTNLLFNQMINCKLKEKNNFINYNNINKYKINKIFTINDKINEYITDNGEEFYKIGLQYGLDYEKTWELEEFLNEIGSSLFILVPKNNTSNKLKIIIDKIKYYNNYDDNYDDNKTICDEKIKPTSIDVNINIHDKINIFNMIEQYKNEKCT